MANTININGKTCPFSEGETILQVASRNGIHIPTLCHLKGTSPTGACRICIVEVKGAPGPIASCSTPAVNDMEVLTETPRIIQARKTVIELLLISGNHNCAARGNYSREWTDFQYEVEDYDQADNICVAYGECKLQALAYKYMVTERSVERIPTRYPLEYDDPLIGRDFSRCILCGRCVQACNEVQVNNALSHGYRGNISKIVVRGDHTLPQSDCVYCGECVQSCPVGSLFEKRYRFGKRMWDTKHSRASCFYCGVGCQLDLSIQDNRIVKIDGSEDMDPNHGRLCFKGRFAFDFLTSKKRLTKPMIKKQGTLQESSWPEVIPLLARKINELKDLSGPDSIGCLVSTKYSNEDLFQVKKFFSTVVQTDQITHYNPPVIVKISYPDILDADTVVVVGHDICRDNPVAASYIKQSVLKGKKLIVVGSKDWEISRHAHEVLSDTTQIEKKTSGKTIIFYDPAIDRNTLPDGQNFSLNTIGMENNTLGAYILALQPNEDFDPTSCKMLYSMGDHGFKTKTCEFLIVQDLFLSDASQYADVVLPAAAWIEYEGTYISSNGLLHRITRIVNAPGDAKPTWWIFREIAKAMGEHWDSKSGREIWEKEIILKDPRFIEYDYDTLGKQGQKIPWPLDFAPFDPGIFPENIIKLNTHKKLCLHCQDLEDIIKKRIKEDNQ